MEGWTSSLRSRNESHVQQVHNHYVVPMCVSPRLPTHCHQDDHSPYGSMIFYRIPPTTLQRRQVSVQGTIHKSFLYCFRCAPTQSAPGSHSAADASLE